MTDDRRTKKAMQQDLGRKHLKDTNRKTNEALKRERLKRAAYDGATDRERKYMRKCRRAKEIPRLGSSGVGGRWGL